MSMTSGANEFGLGCLFIAIVAALCSLGYILVTGWVMDTPHVVLSISSGAIVCMILGAMMNP